MIQNSLVKFACGVAGVAAGLAACSPEEGAPGRYLGEAQSLGNGTIQTFVETHADGTPATIGVEMTAAALVGLPEKRNDFSRCYDVDGDGALGPMECEGDEERKLDLPAEAANMDLPFTWAGVNYNPEGHIPENWAVPHFDFHFYMVSQEAVKNIRTGSCGILMNCDDFAIATKPVEARFVPPDYINIGAAVSEMGNHLLDSTSPQAGPPFAKAEHIMVFGAWDGHITFLEPMITMEVLASNPNACFAIKQPEAYEIGGYYPTEYCIRSDEERVTISLEGLTHHPG